MTFWILTITLALVVALFMARALLVGGKSEEHPAAYDLRVYRDQLKEVDRDLERGIVSTEDAERARTEISRKILAADAKLKEADEAGDTGAGRSPLVVLVISLVCIGGALGVYWQLGAPGYGDYGIKARFAEAQQIRETRPSQADVESDLPDLPATNDFSADVLELIEKLRQAVANNPDDIQGLTLLASNEARLGNFSAAYTAQARLIEVKGDGASAEDYVSLGELMILAADGYVSPEAETALTRALRLNENHPVARYYMGLMMAQTGRPDVTFRVWRELLNEGPENAPWIAPIRSQIMDAAAWAGVDYELPAVAPIAGPSAEDIAAAGEMDAADQQAMIRGMVQRLSDRLASEGGSAAEWAQLISALGVLGDTDQARAIWAEAQAVFASDPAGLAQVRAGAQRAGVAE
jgi:cytochrome c-type biogenesis protein CcmH